MITTMDDDGRVSIPKKYQDRLSKRMFVVDTHDGLLLIPVPDDPIAELEKIGKKLPAMTIKELRAEINKQAIKEEGIIPSR